MTDEQTDEREIALRDSKSSPGRPQEFFKIILMQLQTTSYTRKPIKAAGA